MYISYIYLITVRLTDKFLYIYSCRVSRSGKITFNTCFAVYKIHFRRARSTIYITANPSVLFHYINLFFWGAFHESSFGYESSSIQSRLQYIGYIYLIFYDDHIPRLAFPIYIPPIYQPVKLTKTALIRKRSLWSKLRVLTQF
jgi:hypothetical protein